MASNPIFSFVSCGQDLGYQGGFAERIKLGLQSYSELDGIDKIPIEIVFVEYESDGAWIDSIVDELPANIPIKFVRVWKENLTPEEQAARFPEVKLLNIGLRHFSRGIYRAAVSFDAILRKDYLKQLDWLWNFYYPLHYQNRCYDLILTSSRTEIPQYEHKGKTLDEIWDYVDKNLDNLETERLQQSFWGCVGDFTMTSTWVWEKLSGYNEKMLKDSWLDLEFVLWGIFNHIPVVDMLNRCGKCLFHLEHETRRRKATENNQMIITDVGRHNPLWGSYTGNLEVITNGRK